MSLPLIAGNEHDERLRANVHPEGHVNPTPEGRYNLVVLGAGTAGLVAAMGAAGLGAKVALVERGLLGGDCLNVGCVPSKGVLHAGRVAHGIRSASQAGIEAGELRIDFPAVMDRMRAERARISKADAVSRCRDAGVDVYLGEAAFASEEAVSVAGRTLTFDRCVIATGGRAAAPKIDGLDGVEYLTNENVFNLTAAPASLGVVGGGAIGCELAQAFARLGVPVTLFQKGPRLLPKELADAGRIVEESLRADGVTVVLDADVQSVRESGEGIELTVGGRKHAFAKLLVAVGRAPNVESLNLPAAGVEYDPKKGVHTDDRLQTSNGSVFASGDVTSQYKFTHAADALSRIALKNALFFGRQKASDLVIPWCTYTDPEVARVGVDSESAEQPTDVYRVEMADVDRAILEGDDSGFAEVVCEKGGDRILGATLVSAHAGETIPVIVLAMTAGIGLGKLASVIHPYPTQAEVFKKIADRYNRTRLTPTVSKLMSGWFRWKR